MTGQDPTGAIESLPEDAIPDATTLELNSVFVAIMRATSRRGEAFTASFDLTPARVAVLSILHRNPDRPLTVGEIAAGLHVSSTNISRRLDGLQKDGWIRRDPNPADARSIFVRLTDDGRRQAGEIMPAIYNRLNIVWSCFDEKDKSQVLAYLSRFLDHLHTSPSLVSPADDQ